MNLNQNYLEIMKASPSMALASSLKNVVNVRIVNFYYNPLDKKIIFASFDKNPKTKELAENPRVAITTIPVEGNAHIRGNGIARKSEQSIYAYQAEFVNKIPEYAEMIKFAGDQLVVFEIEFDEIVVTESLDNIYTMSSETM